ncbi:hypothetical protein HAX54_010157 [Datura stramonium]|uniref:Uncharacterized protein n=1 Tax=Datura stramonium TaxID=4076 RepID=A0ABS8WZQ9_DATST|nr:hypothetical protein [Datura stramonium]
MACQSCYAISNQDTRNEACQLFTEGCPAAELFREKERDRGRCKYGGFSGKVAVGVDGVSSFGREKRREEGRGGLVGVLCGFPVGEEEREKWCGGHGGPGMREEERGREGERD